MYDNRLYDGAADALAQLSSTGTRLALATSKLGDFADAILGHFGLRHYFEVVAGASRDGSRSHKADVAAYALEGLGHPDPGCVALVGDREQDMYAAGELGLYGVGALWGYGSEAELLGAGAQVLVPSPAALVPVLERGKPG
jgi:phosphoglycolate phosphatase